MIGEVCLTNCIETRYGGLKVIIYPDTAHSVVYGRIYHHWLLVRIGSGNLLVHLEKVAVTLAYLTLTETLDCSLEIKEYGKTGLIHAEAGVTALLCRTGSHVTRNEVSKGRITALEIVVAVLFCYIGRKNLLLAELEDVLHLLRNPDTAVVTQRL